MFSCFFFLIVCYSYKDDDIFLCIKFISTTLLNSLVRTVFLVETLGFSFMSYVNSDDFISCPVWMLFISFTVWLLWLGLCWIKVVRDIFVLFLVLEERLSAFHHWVCDVSCEFVMNGVYFVELCCLCASFDESFYQECTLNFVKCFFCIYWHDLFVNMLYHIDLFADIKPSFHPCNNPTWSCCMILYIYCWIWLANIL